MPLCLLADGRKRPGDGAAGEQVAHHAATRLLEARGRTRGGLHAMHHH